jgi:signal transduction histidine kinase
VTTVAAAQAALIGGLLVQRRRRRQAEAQLRERETLLRKSFDRLRDIGVRLIHAQEDERARIARELHDDVAQQIALLRIHLHGRGDADVLARIDALARSVHELSHRLHPSKLRVLGLVDALRSLQQEHARSGIAMVFTHDEITAPIPRDLTVCLFRVVQEALQNAAKYSRASHLSVALRQIGGSLALTVEDNGVGFDLAAVCDRGLGLISMRERVEAAGGAVEICSNPGRGTRVQVTTPLDDPTRHRRGRAVAA